jgi:hypothetical protein
MKTKIFVGELPLYIQDEVNNKLKKHSGKASRSQDDSGNCIILFDDNTCIGVYENNIVHGCYVKEKQYYVIMYNISDISKLKYKGIFFTSNKLHITNVSELSL